MRTVIRFAAAYIRYYKKQTIVLLLGIAVSAALLTGIGSLLESGQNAVVENARAEYGNWHYYTRGDASWVEAFMENPRGSGYELECYGFETVRKMIEEPDLIQLVYADQNYLDMMGRTLVWGTYPEKENEIAMDIHTLRNLNIPEEPGSQVVLDQETFTLCGVLTEMPEELPSLMGNYMQVFVNDTLDYGKNGTFLYLRFKEDGNVYKQAEAFCSYWGLSGGDLFRNNGIDEFVGSGMPVNVLEVIKTGLENKSMGIPYIWGALNAGGILMRRGFLLAIGFFGIYIIYSLFQISVSRRMGQYSVMQALGMTDSMTFRIILSELCLIFAVGYPVGTIVGNGVASLIYKRAGRIFIPQDQAVHIGMPEQNLEAAVSNLPDAGSFCVNWEVILLGAAFLLCVLAAISLLMTVRMKQATLRQMMARDTGKRKKRKIYSIKHENMPGILTRKFMFARKTVFLGVLFSLSVGSVMFLSSAYVTENTKRNNELTFKADDGLGSDIQIYEESDQLTDVIPEQTAGQMSRIDGVEAVHPVRYLVGEIYLENGTFTWPVFYPELGYTEGYEPDPELMEKYNGIAVQTGDDDFALKVNIYGYDDEMLLELNDYLLEGSIDPDQMRQENSVIFKTIMDGQGNYDGIDIHPGDTVQLKTVSDTAVPAEALKFLGGDDWYQQKSMKVSAISSRHLAKVDTYIGDSYDNVVNIIMTNEQMEENFGVTDYQTISIMLTENADADQVAENLAELTKEIDKCIVKDYTRQIAAQNLYLAQKMLFFYGIAALLLGSSILHIMNSMQNLMTERRHEFGILRAMGITDEGLCKMLAREGLHYGIYSGLVITAVFLIVQKMLYFLMVHVYLYQQTKAYISRGPFIAVIGLNLLICIAVTLLSGRVVLKQQIIDVIRE